MQEFGARTGNVQRWWEQHEKFEKDLVMLQPFEDDDEDLLSKIDDVRKPWLEDRRSKKKSKKNKKSKVNIESFLTNITIFLYRKTIWKRWPKINRR
jgi:hypothetical protein